MLPSRSFIFSNFLELPKINLIALLTNVNNKMYTPIKASHLKSENYLKNTTLLAQLIETGAKTIKL